MTNFIRQPAVAGMFYPGDKTELHQSIETYLQQATQKQTEAEEVPKAIIVPHAGYIYSGPVAASAYARLLPAKRANPSRHPVRPLTSGAVSWACHE